jgi:hypothetical protein
MIEPANLVDLAAQRRFPFALVELVAQRRFPFALVELVALRRVAPRPAAQPSRGATVAPRPASSGATPQRRRKRRNLRHRSSQGSDLIDNKQQTPAPSRA